MTSSHRPSLETLGSRIARLLAGSWRPDPGAADLSTGELESIHSLVLSSGAAGLAWRRVNGSPLAETPEGIELRETWRQQVLETAIHESQVRLTIEHLAKGGVNPLLVKGVATALYYPAPGLRTPRDIDVVVPPEEHRRAIELLRPPPFASYFIDLKPGLDGLDLGPWYKGLPRDTDTLFVEGCAVPILRPEAHLRLLCIHLIKHGALRPIWLCDVAATVDNLPVEFDTRLFLGEDPVHAKWFRMALALARDLLGARLDRLEGSDPVPPAPAWLKRHVMRRWGGLLVTAGLLHRRIPMAAVLRRPWLILSQGQLRGRWPEPMETAMRFQRGLDRRPSFWWTLASIGRLSGLYVKKRAASVPHR